MAPSFDIFLACAPKDFLKLPYVINSIVKNIDGYENIIICSPHDIPIQIMDKIEVMYYTYIDENGLPGVTRSGWRFRPNWCFQQHLKLFQKVTADWYLTIDCDTIINRPMKFFDGDKPIWYRGMNQYYPPYFNFMKRMIDLDRMSLNTYIADMNLIHRPVINDMLSRNGMNIETFIRKSQGLTDKDCHIGEPELYGNYCKKFFPGMYIEVDLSQAPFVGRHQKGVEDSIYPAEEIESKIAEMSDKPFDTFSLHSWLEEGN